MGGASRYLTRFRLRLQLKQMSAAGKNVPFYIIPTPYALCGGRKSACPHTAHKSYYAKCHWFCLAANVLYGAVAPNPTHRSAPWWLRTLSKSLGFRYAPVVFLRATQKRYILKRASCAALHPCCGCASRFV